MNSAEDFRDDSSFASHIVPSDRVGAALGTLVGTAVGLPVGTAVGEELGAGVGTFVGLGVRPFVGVGTAVVRSAVGAADGTTVGLGVGCLIENPKFSKYTPSVGFDPAHGAIQTPASSLFSSCA